MLWVMEVFRVCEIILNLCDIITSFGYLLWDRNKMYIITLVLSLFLAPYATALLSGGLSFTKRNLSKCVSGTYASNNNNINKKFTPLFLISDNEEDGISLEAAEALGRGAAKKKRGERKPASASASASPETFTKTKTKTNTAPEETFYEGPPSITETLVPTISILTVIGIVPAAASWARQAWVRYKITNRRIRVNSGFRGKDMAEIVYGDITEIRTAKRLFGDGDCVLMLRDGAKFELRNVPQFEGFVEFVLGLVNDDVKSLYEKGGDVTNPKN